MLTRRGIVIHPEEFNENWLARAREAGLNVLGLHPVGGAKASESLEAAIWGHTLPETKRLIASALANGIQIEYEAHALSWLLPRPLFAPHPEWFRMNESGERVNDANLCPSNEEALAYVGARAALLEQSLFTGASRHSFWLDDVAGKSCHCPACRALTPADQQLKVMNALLTALRTVNPRAMLSHLVYGDAQGVPQKIQPLDGIFLEYAPMSRDIARPLNDPENARNVAVTKSLKPLLDYFGTAHARVLGYWTDNSWFSNWVKPPKRMALDEDVMRRDVDYLRGLGFDDITSFGCFLGDDYVSLHGEPPIRRYGEILRGAR